MLWILKFLVEVKKSQYFWSDSRRLVSLLQKRSQSKLTETKIVLIWHLLLIRKTSNDFSATPSNDKNKISNVTSWSPLFHIYMFQPLTLNPSLNLNPNLKSNFINPIFIVGQYCTGSSQKNYTMGHFSCKWNGIDNIGSIQLHTLKQPTGIIPPLNCKDRIMVF